MSATPTWWRGRRRRTRCWRVYHRSRRRRAGVRAQGAIDEGVVAGPAIYPSGAMITVTSGHGDFRQSFEVPRTLGRALMRMEQIGGSLLADSPDEVRLRAREQLLLGATQIKLTAGGGVASPHSPLDVTTFTEAELRAAVEAAENWGTYVTVHAYTPASIQRAIAAGVKCIEHGHLMDEATAKLIAERGVWLEHSGVPRRTGRRVSARLATTGQGVRGVRRHGYRVSASAEAQAQNGVGHRHPVFPEARASPRGTARQAGTLVHPRRNARHGDRDERRTAGPVREAQPLSRQAGCRGRRCAGRSAAGRWRPLTNIKLIADPARNFVVIMKDGKVYKNLIR